MNTFTRRNKAALLPLATLMLGAAPPALAEGFVEDSTLEGTVYYWQRHRERKDLDPHSAHYQHYQTNLHHSTLTGALDYQSGYLADTVGIDVAAFATWDLFEGSPAHPNEISFSHGPSMWKDRGVGERNGLDLYRAALKLKAGDYWLRAGYIQPSGQTLLGTQWGFLPGTYQGVEVGAVYDYGAAGALSLSWMGANKYKAPWYRKMYEFREIDRQTRIPYLHSLGAKYDFKNGNTLELAWGESPHYLDKYFAKAARQTTLWDNPFSVSWQFYGSQDRTGRHDVYDEFAWQQGLTLAYQWDRYQFRLEGSAVHAPGKQGYYTVAMTPIYPNSAGRIDMWWDSRSDFNADGEKALFAGLMIDLSDIVWPGVSIGGSFAWGWDGKPARGGDWSQQQRLTETAINGDLVWQVQSGWAKDTVFKLHLTAYNNHSDNPSWGGGYGNVFQDEKDVKFMMIAPFSLFNHSRH